MKKYCVYRHRRLDNNKIFYIGMGSLSRPYSINNRNSSWYKTVIKYGYAVKILFKDLSKEDAYDLEVLLIQEYGRKDKGLGSLVNMTDGGDFANYQDDKYKTNKKVFQYSSDGSFIKEWSNMSEAERGYNINPNASNIRSCVRGKNVSAYGFIWKSTYSLNVEPIKLNRRKKIIQ